MKNKLFILMLFLLLSKIAFAGTTFEFVTKEEPRAMSAFLDNARVLLIEKVYPNYVIRESS